MGADFRRISMTASSVITSEHLAVAQSYEAYRQMIDGLLVEGKTTGDNHSEDMLHYTKLNVQRMHRLDKTIVLQKTLQDKLTAVASPWTWLVLTEAWCGDAAQIVPVMAKMADASPYITLQLLLRDEYPEVMDAYLTNGSRSIPKLICLTEDRQEIGTWGPRPDAAQQSIVQFEQNHPNEDHRARIEDTQLWYSRDRTKAIQQEFIELLTGWNRDNR